MLQGCLNGARTPEEHPALPVTPAELAADAEQAVAAGATSLHVHPKDAAGHDDLTARCVDPLVDALRLAVPATPIGVTTGAWAATSPAARLDAVRSWASLPDFASVNWHEDGAVDLADLLLHRGIGIEAGLFTVAAAEAWTAWSGRDRCLRAMVEIADLPAREAVEAAALVLAVLDGLLRDPASRVPHHQAAQVRVLLHGEDRSAWPLLAEAAVRGLDVRIGLEDALVLPDGTPAASNAALVAAARQLLGARG